MCDFCGKTDDKDFDPSSEPRQVLSEAPGSVADIPASHLARKSCREARKYGCTLELDHNGPHVAEADRILDTWE